MTDYSKIRIALDGPSGAGKSTIAKKIAEKIGLVYVDTGALYRSVGLYSIENGIDSEDTAGIIASLEKINIRLAYEDGCQKVYLNGSEVGNRIRTPQASKYASAVSKIPEVRAFLLKLQRDIAASGGVIMDGRDIGTVVLPNADVKIFLTASVEERARRRYKELCEKGIPAELSVIEEEIRQRDEQDMNRPIAPLKQAEDAVLLDTSAMNIEESIEALLAIVASKLS